QPASNAERLAVIRDGDVLIASPLGGLEHVDNGARAIAQPSVGVQVTSDVAQLHEAWQGTLAGQLDLAPVLADFGRDPWQSEGSIHSLVSRASQASFAFEDSVLVELEAATDGDLAERHVVLFGASEVLHRRAEAL